MTTTDADALYTSVHPDYFETQRRDLFWYERLWGVLLGELERLGTNRWLIEFGSGPGFLLAQARRRGWLAIGIEPSAVAREHAGRLGVMTYEGGSVRGGFHAAIATEVLEHVDDPTTTLLEWREALVSGGYLALSVPNDNNPLQRLFWSQKKPWFHHTHKSYFNPKSLKALVESSGFEVVWQRTSFPVEILLVLPIPRHWAWKLSRVWPAPPLLWRWGIGRHVLLVARKHA